MTDVVLPFWYRPTFCLITGASQGIGRQIAVEFAQKVGSGSVFVLLARSKEELKKTQDLVKAANPCLQVATAPLDLLYPDPKIYTGVILNSLKDFEKQPSSFELALIVHNAGTIGDVTELTADMYEPRKWLDYLTVNLVSAICLNSVFLNIFPVDTLNEVCILNITSLCGIKPFKSMAHYCVGKASREMFFKVLALENPLLNVLSYSPGPVDTDMHKAVAENVVDPETKEMFVTTRKSGKILTAEQTTKRCIKVLSGRKYNSGDHVDYYDTEY